MGFPALVSFVSLCNLLSDQLQAKEAPMSAYDENNIFAKILRGEIPCTKVYEDEHVLAFNDIRPQAPVHILVIPKGKYVSIVDFGAKAAPAELKAFYAAVSKIAAEQGLADAGFRSIANTGLNGGQEVPHFHIHLLGGRPIGPMVAKAA
jgi:histidine triad (HIT) family protein